jgi:hypothetical protein
MPKLSHLMISLPLMAVPLSVIGLKPVAAQTVTPVEALELLAKSSAVDAKCKVLPQTEREELNGYLAKAEVATTARSSVDDAKTAIMLGRKSGEVAACGPASAGEVAGTLAAAREAMAEVRRPRSSSMRARKVARYAPRDTAQPAQIEIRGSSGLKLYARQVMAYYVERRCKHLSAGSARNFWRRIVSSYESAVRSYGPQRVARIQSRAEADAGTWNCGERSVRLVEAAYDMSRRF